MDDGAQKRRRHGMVKHMFILMNSERGSRCAGLFKLNITITKKDGLFIVDPTTYEEGKVLDPIKTLYDQREFPNITSVAACVVSDSLLYVIPHNENKATLPFHLMVRFNHVPPVVEPLPILEPRVIALRRPSMDLIKLSKFLSSPQEGKHGPIVASIDHTVFALSTLVPSCPFLSSCFESLDLVTNIWSTLKCPKFHDYKNVEEDAIRKGIIGFAVMKQHGILLFSLRTHSVSYNTRTLMWKNVNLETTTTTPPANVTHGDDNVLRKPQIFGEAIVFNNGYLYTYDPSWSHQLFVIPFSFSDAKKSSDNSFDLSLDMARLVRGVDYRRNSQKENHRGNFGHYVSTGTVVRVDRDILCLLRALCPFDPDVQIISLIFIKLIHHAECITLNSFTCTLSAGIELYSPTIKSCFVLDDPEEEGDNYCSKQTVLPNEADGETSMKLERCGGIGEAAA